MCSCHILYKYIQLPTVNITSPPYCRLMLNIGMPKPLKAVSIFITILTTIRSGKFYHDSTDAEARNQFEHNDSALSCIQILLYLIVELILRAWFDWIAHNNSCYIHIKRIVYSLPKTISSLELTLQMWHDYIRRDLGSHGSMKQP